MSSTSVPLDIDDIQGDIVLGLPKKFETFYFFKIDPKKLSDFRSGLSRVIPLITTTGDVQEDHQKISAEKRRAKKAGVKPKLLDIGGVNIAFSHLGIKAEILGDGQWAREFLNNIDGVILATGHNPDKAEAMLGCVLEHIGGSIIEIYQITGHVRPEKVEAHEHFGYADGIAHPIVLGVPGTIHPGKDVIDQGIIFAGRKEDRFLSNRPDWAIDGSFMVFRKLKQLVPEFNDFLERNKLPTDDTTPPDEKIGRLSAGAELLGARLVGRWKSGAPVENTHLKDDLTIATHPHVNDDFRYDLAQDQIRCPFAAHTRKTNPRNDLAFLPPDSPFRTEARRIMRHGIQYGEEVTRDEKKKKKSSEDPDLERGLLFVCYQSSIGDGFQFIQQSWANTDSFPPGKPIDAGLDALIGVNPSGPDGKRRVNGHDPANLPTSKTPTEEEIEKQQLVLDNLWVIPQGGEYFFSPSIASLRKHFAKEAGAKAGHHKKEL